MLWGDHVKGFTEVQTNYTCTLPVMESLHHRKPLGYQPEPALGEAELAVLNHTSVSCPINDWPQSSQTGRAFPGSHYFLPRSSFVAPLIPNLCFQLSFYHLKKSLKITTKQLVAILGGTAIWHLLFKQ